MGANTPRLLLEVSSFFVLYMMLILLTRITTTGGIYALIILAGQGMRTTVAKMDGNVHRDLANMLRNPPEGTCLFDDASYLSLIINSLYNR